VGRKVPRGRTDHNPSLAFTTMMNIVFTVFTTIVVFSVFCIDGGVAAFRSSSSRTVVVSPSFVLATRGGASDGSESSSSSNNSKHDAKLEIAKSKAIERAYAKVCGVRFNLHLYNLHYWRTCLCDRS
jgi:hypothetical protein